VTWLQAILLGLLQGITEFLPVSSTAHLKLLEFFLDLKLSSDEAVFICTICHLGTLCSTTLFFKRTIYSILHRLDLILFHFIIPIIPLFPLILCRSSLVKTFDRPEYFCYFFWITAFILWLGEKSKNSLTPWIPIENRILQALWVGTWQASAILPGLSRSGLTVSAGRMLGWSLENAVLYSFLLAIPTGLGAFAVEGISLIAQSHNYMGRAQILNGLLAFTVSFGVGYATLSFVWKKVRQSVSLMPFVWYCSGLGILLWLYFKFH
jgi:undecaprenyl-diphosphatase